MATQSHKLDVQPYDGGDGYSIILFLQDYNVLADARDPVWTAQQRAQRLVNHLVLQSRAYHVFLALPAETKWDWDALQAAFRTQFNTQAHKRRLENRILQEKQKPNETVQQFATRLRKLVVGLDNVERATSLARQAFLNGVSYHLAWQLKGFFPEEEFGPLVQKATDLEMAAKEQSDKESQGQPRPLDQYGVHHVFQAAAPVFGTNMHRRSSRYRGSSRRAGTRRPPSGRTGAAVCHNCRQPGHFRAECPEASSGSGYYARSYAQAYAGPTSESGHNTQGAHTSVGRGRGQARRRSGSRRGAPAQVRCVYDGDGFGSYSDDAKDDHDPESYSNDTEDFERYDDGDQDSAEPMQAYGNGRQKEIRWQIAELRDELRMCTMESPSYVGCILSRPLPTAQSGRPLAATDGGLQGSQEGWSLPPGTVLSVPEQEVVPLHTHASSEDGPKPRGRCYSLDANLQLSRSKPSRCTSSLQLSTLLLTLLLLVGLVPASHASPVYPTALSGVDDSDGSGQDAMDILELIPYHAPKAPDLMEGSGEATWHLDSPGSGTGPEPLATGMAQIQHQEPSASLHGTLPALLLSSTITLCLVLLWYCRCGARQPPPHGTHSSESIPLVSVPYSSSGITAPLLVVALMVLLVPRPVATTPEPHLCPSNGGTVIWQLPTSPNCTRALMAAASETGPVSAVTVQLYSLQHASPMHANICSCFVERVGTWKPFIGNQVFTNTSITPLPVSLELCRTMIQNRTSPYGSLMVTPGGLATANPVQWPSLWAPWHWGWWHYAETVNCHVSADYMLEHHRSGMLHSPAFTLPVPSTVCNPTTHWCSEAQASNCNRSAGWCQLPDQRLVMWHPLDHGRCAKPNGPPIAGYQFQTASKRLIWIAKDASHLIDTGPTTSNLFTPNCSSLTGRLQLQLSDVDTSPLNYFTATTPFSATFPHAAFLSALALTCARMQHVTPMPAHDLAADPTFLQSVAPQSSVAAYQQDHLIAFRPCYPLPGNYTLARSRSQYPWTPIRFAGYHDWHHGYLHQETGQVHPRPAGDYLRASLRQVLTMAIDDALKHGFFQTLHPASAVISASEVLLQPTSSAIPAGSLALWPTVPSPDLASPHVPLYTSPLVRPQPSALDFWSPVPVGPFHFVLLLLALYVAALAILLHCCPFSHLMVFFNPYYALRALCSHYSATPASPRSYSKHRWRSPRFRRRTREAQLDQHARQQRHTDILNHLLAALLPQSAWAPVIPVKLFPPTAPFRTPQERSVPSQSGAGSDISVSDDITSGTSGSCTTMDPPELTDHQPRVTQCTEGMIHDGLVDTGAQISLISQATVQKYGYSIQPVLRQATSISGHALELTGVCYPRLRVGQKLTQSHPFYICPTLPHAVVLGFDYLRECLGGTVLVDTVNGRLAVDSKPVPATGSIPLGDHVPDQAVHLLTTEVIPPRSARICWVECPQATNLVGYHFSPAERLAQTTGMTLWDELVSPQEHCIPVSILNEGHEPKSVYAGTRLGTLNYVGQPTLFNIQPCSARVAAVMATTVKAQKPVLTLPQELDGLSLDETTLTPEQKQQLTKLLVKFKDVFATPDDSLGCIPDVVHRVNTEGQPPVRSKPYRTAFCYRDEVRSQIKKMLELGVIRPSHSPYASPIVLVPKKSGEIRFCIDFRRLNAQTRKDVFPLPSATEVFDQLGQARYFTCLDMANGYWHVQMAPEDMEKTAFTTFDGLYEWVRMPFGLTNAPATFQRAIQRVMNGLEPHRAIVYMDDVLIHSATFEQHLQDLQAVLERIRVYNLKLKVSKCHFSQPKVAYLGHIISAAGIEPDPAKVTAVQNFLAPKDTTTLRRFLGLSGYYRRFICGYAQLACPLFRLLKQNERFLWTKDHQDALDHLKEALTSAPILQFPAPSQPYILETDASGLGLGAVLLQELQSHKPLPIAYASRTLSKHERNYSATELEALAVHWALKHFKTYVYGQRCTIYTDHQALQSLMTIKEPQGRLARWQLALQDLNLEFKYRPGRKNEKADFLSRCFQVAMVTNESITLQEAQHKDPVFGPICHFLETGQRPDGLDPQQDLEQESKHFQLRDGILVRKESHKRRQHRQQAVVPMSLRMTILEAFHADRFSGHLGQKKTADKIGLKFWWPNLVPEVNEFVRACSRCQESKQPAPPHQPPLKSITTPEPWHTVEMDFMELPLTPNGKKYVLVLQDHFTKWIEAFATGSQDTTTVAEIFVTKWMCHFGAPQRLLSDKAATFVSALVKEICMLCGTIKVTSTAYSPQTDGLVERSNRHLQAILRAYVSKNQTDWDLFLPFATFAANSSVHETTHETPFFLTYGRDPALPIERTLNFQLSPYVQLEDASYAEQMQHHLTTAWQEAERHSHMAQERQARYHDAHAKETTYQEGDKVLVWTPTYPGRAAKLGRPWKGPFVVLKTYDNNTLLVMDWEEPEHPPVRIHTRRIKPFTDAADATSPAHMEPHTKHENPTVQCKQTQHTQKPEPRYFLRPRT